MQFLTHFLFPPARQQGTSTSSPAVKNAVCNFATVLMKNPILPRARRTDQRPRYRYAPNIGRILARLPPLRHCSQSRSLLHGPRCRPLAGLQGRRGNRRLPGKLLRISRWKSLRDREEQEATDQVESKLPRLHKTKNLGRREKAQAHVQGKAEKCNNSKQDIEALEAEKSEIEAALCSGTLRSTN